MTLQVLVFKDNCFGGMNLSTADISDILSSNPSLTSLHLSGSRINDKDLNSMANALANNATLSGLKILRLRFEENWGRFERRHLSPSYGTKKAWMQLLTQIILVKLIVFLSPKNNEHDDLKLNRRMKIYPIISTCNRNSENVGHLTEDGMKTVHLPQTLESVHILKSTFWVQVSKRLAWKWTSSFLPILCPYTLSIVYEVVKGWHMPLHSNDNWVSTLVQRSHYLWVIYFIVCYLSYICNHEVTVHRPALWEVVI